MVEPQSQTGSASLPPCPGFLQLSEGLFYLEGVVPQTHLAGNMLEPHPEGSEPHSRITPLRPGRPRHGDQMAPTWFCPEPRREVRNLDDGGMGSGPPLEHLQLVPGAQKRT